MFGDLNHLFIVISYITSFHSNMYNSQIGQDRWVQHVLGDKRDGFFVELGACDGIHFSNTLFFERERGWKGICIEPNEEMFRQLYINRTCMVTNALVYSEPNVMLDFSMCGTASAILGIETGPFTTRNAITKKKTTTLERILDDAHAPSMMDYLSLDVEGQEYNILRTFPFHKYAFRCITVEHNAPHIGPEQQRLICDLLEKNGYRYVKGNDDVNGWGHGPIDDFYCHSSVELPTNA